MITIQLLILVEVSIALFLLWKLYRRSETGSNVTTVTKGERPEVAQKE